MYPGEWHPEHADQPRAFACSLMQCPISNFCVLQLPMPSPPSPLPPPDKVEQYVHVTMANFWCISELSVDVSTDVIRTLLPVPLMIYAGIESDN